MRTSPLTLRQIIFWSLLLTVAMEGVTIVLRFGFDLESARHTSTSIGAITHGIRVHHGYAGVLMILASFFCRRLWPACSRWILVIGLACVLSDLIHHFAVLWPVVGSPEFDLVYPE